jgi:hypothetical protein
MKIIFTLIFFCTAVAFSQGVFESAASGDWNNAASWNLVSGTDPDGIPDADDNVTILATHTITLDANSSVNNIILSGTSGTRLATENFILEVNGTLEGDGTSQSTTHITSGTGKVKFIGSSRALFGSNWSASPHSWRLEIALDIGETGTASTAVKAGDIIITSGTFSLPGELRPDKGAANTGTLTVETGATLIVGTRLSRTGTANTPFESLTLNGTGKLTLTGNNTSVFPTTGLTTSFSATSTVEFTGTGSQTVPDYNNYGNIVLGTSGIKAWSPAANRSVSGNITVSGTAFWSWGGGNQITMSGNFSSSVGSTVSAGSSANRLIASGVGRTFTGNGIIRVASNHGQTPAATAPFTYQYNNFATYSFGASSTVEFRIPSSAANAISQNIHSASGASFQNVKIEHNSVGGTLDRTFTFTTDVTILGNLVLEHNGTTGGYTVDFSSRTVKIGGNVTATGAGTGTRTYTMGTSTIEFDGSSAQTIAANNTPAAFNNLTINNNAGATANNAVTVDGDLTFVDGKLTLGGNTLTLGTFGSIIGASVTNYIVTNSTGVLRINSVGASDVLFPVGTAASYAPVTINNAGTTDDFLVRAKSTYLNPPLNGNHVNIFWDINEAVEGGSDATLTLQWNSSDESGTFNRNSDLHIGRFDGTTWVGMPATLGGTDPYTATASGFNTFSEFGVGSDGALPVELETFTASLKGTSVQLNWTTATEIDNYGFEVERATNNNNIESPLSWEKVAFVAGAGNSNSVKKYSYTDNLSAGGKYAYRLKQIDNTGEYTYSHIVEVDVTVPVEYSLSQNYPNPFNPVTVINYNLPMESSVQLNVYTITGELVASLVNEVQSAGSYNISFDASRLASGTYIYRIIANDFVKTNKMILIK